ncbi:hypothetical protein [Streptomyces sp. NPDC014006]|uniref:hypothetical protein n=1 Tax=Streptomyces sp. NPDC014006 TaxID=3364870 RepID=UPI0036F6E617
MADSEAYRWGQVYAGLHTLWRLAGERERLDEVRFDAAKKPRAVVGARLQDVFATLAKAKSRKETYAKAAAEVLGTLAEAHPPRSAPPVSLGEAEQNDFLKGFGCQQGRYDGLYRELLT